MDTYDPAIHCERCFDRDGSLVLDPDKIAKLHPAPEE